MTNKRLFTLEEYNQLLKDGKEFRLETPDNRPARIICTNRTDKNLGHPIIALETDLTGTENIVSYHDTFVDLFIITEEEPKYRPYTMEEFDKAVLEKRGYVIFKDREERYSVVSWNKEGVWLGDMLGVGFKALFGLYTWLDGTPCGIEGK